MRRSDREITDYDDILEVVKRCDVCRIAMFDEEYPYIVPMNFGYTIEEDNSMVIYFTAQKKEKNTTFFPKTTMLGLKWTYQDHTKKEASPCNMKA